MKGGLIEEAPASKLAGPRTLPPSLPHKGAQKAFHLLREFKAGGLIKEAFLCSIH